MSTNILFCHAHIVSSDTSRQEEHVVDIVKNSLKSLSADVSVKQFIVRGKERLFAS